MITKEELRRISRMVGMKPHQQEKHYLQTLILRSLYSKFNPIFKGGTALMFSYGLNRFSEDLDFTQSEKELDGQDIIETIIGDLEYIGIASSFRIITDNAISFSFRIGAEGPLFTREIERCYVRLEISKREKVILDPRTFFIEGPYPDMLPFSTTILNPVEMIAEKIRAIVTRNRARDVYDLWYLMKDIDLKNKSSMYPSMNSLVNVKLGYYNRKLDVDELERYIALKEDIWKAELTPILFGQLPDFITVTKDIMKNVYRWD